jgi:hypothetical protein
LFRYRAWAGIALGAFLANATTNAPLATAAGRRRRRGCRRCCSPGCSPRG